VPREGVLQKLAQDIGSHLPVSLNLIGFPGKGKSTLLNLVCVKQDVLGEWTGKLILIKMEELIDLTPQGFWAYFVDQINYSLGGNILNKRILGEELDFRSIVDQLKNLSKKIERLVIMFDDGEVLYQVLRPNDFHFLNYIVTECSTFLSFLLTSSTSLRDMQYKYQAGLGGQYLSDWSRGFRELYLPDFTYEETVWYLNKLAEVNEVGLTETDISILLTECGRNPRLLNIGFYLMAAMKKEYHGTEEEFEEIFLSDYRYDGEVRSLCNTYYLSLSDGERRALLRIINRLPVSDVSVVRRLGVLGLVNSNKTGQELFSQTFEYWLRTNIDVTSVEVDNPIKLLYFPEKSMVRAGEIESRLTPVENRLMSFLVANENRTCSIDEIRLNVWGKGNSISVVEKTINRLRQKIETDYRHPKHLLSVRGIGYELHLTAY
jgi:hypothetical protein